MDRINLLLFIILFGLIDHHSTTPVNVNDSIVDSNANLSLSNIDLNDTSANHLNSSSVSTRTFHLFEINSWIVGKVMGGLQMIFGKMIVPDSKIFLLQTLVNPFHPIHYASRFVHDKFAQETRINVLTSQESVEHPKSDRYKLNDILDAIKPKVIDGLSDLVDSGILEKLHPIVNITVKTFNIEHRDREQTNYLNNKQTIFHTQRLNNSVVYDLIDFNDYKKYYNHTGFENHELNPIILKILDAKQVNSSHEFDYSTNHTHDVIANSSLIDNQHQETSISQKDEDEFHKFDNANLQISVDAKVDFRDSKQSSIGNATFKSLSPQMNITPHLSTNAESNDPPAQLNDVDIVNATSNHTELVEQVMSLNNQTLDHLLNNQTSDLTSQAKLNKTEYTLNEDYNKEIVDLFNCEGEKCEKAVWHKLHNETEHYTEMTKVKGSLIEDFVKLLKLINNGLLVNPAVYVYKSFVRLGKLIKKDFNLLLKMVRAALFGTISTKCRYKFLCLFSSFFALHTPDYIKTNMPTQVENYYIKIMDAANRHESLNALVTGYIGFDCNEFYADPRCE